MPQKNTASRPITQAFRLLLVLLGLFTLVYAIFLWQAVKTEKLRELDYLSDFAAGAAEQAFDHYEDNAALLAQALMESGGLRNPVRAHALLVRLKQLNPELSAINLLSSDGQLLMSSQKALGIPMPPLQFSPEEGRLYRQMLASRGLVVFRSRFGALSKRWTIPMFFPVRDASGRVQFVIAQIMPMDNQQALWRDVALPSRAFMAIIREDGYPQSRWPHPSHSAAFYQSVRTGPVVQALRQHPDEQSLTFTGATNAEPDVSQFGAIHRLTGQPMAVVVAQPVAILWRAWLNRLSVPLALLVLVGLGGYAVYRRTLRLETVMERERGAFRQNLESQVQARTAELRVANQELESFSYSVSHDLRAPLRSLDGFSHALLEDYAEQLPPDGQAHLKRIRAAAQRMSQLIDDLLNLSRVTRSQINRETVDFSELAWKTAAQWQQTAPERQVEWLIAPDLRADGDPHLLCIVLENLLGNAWKFTSKQAHARIEFGCLAQASETVYFVRDNGAGFDMRYADKLFGAFQRLHGMTEFEGTGIGLATVARIIHRHGGRVWAEGTVNQGATIYFTL